MPLDGISAKCLAHELNTTLVDARVDRIYQPDRYDILLLLRTGRENVRLILSANPAAPRFHLTTEARENPAEPPMFCMLLRKYLLGARILSVETPGYERIFIIRFQTTNELGDTLEKMLVIEVMGRHSNIIFLNQDNRIHDAILHVDQSVSRLREIMPARTYVEPQNQSKQSPELVLDRLNRNDSPFLPDAADRPLEKAMLESIQGFSPQLCLEVVDQAGLEPRARASQLTTEQLASLHRALHQLLTRILSGAFQPSTYFINRSDSIPFDFHALLLSSLANPRPEKSLSAAMDHFYLERNRQNKINQQKQSLQKRVEQEIENAAKKLQLHEAELHEGEKREYYRQCGELLVSQQHLITEATSFVELQNYYDPELNLVRVELLPNLNANQNAQRYFKLYQKARGKFEMNTRLVGEDRRDLDWLASLLNAVQNVSDEQDIQAIREEIAATGLSAAERRIKDARLTEAEADADWMDSARKPAPKGSNPADLAPGKPGSRAKRQARMNQQASQKSKAKAKAKARNNPPPLPPRAYISSDGFLIQAGRNNLQNDRLTLRTAQKDDLWFHAQKIPGTHVIIRCGKQSVPDRTIAEAAEVAAWFSQAAAVLHTGCVERGPERDLERSQDAHKIAVDYCPVSQVKKIAGGRPGLVQYDHYQTILVRPKDPKAFLTEPDPAGSYPSDQTD